MPSAAKPAVASRDVVLAVVRVTVILVFDVTTADVMSPTANVTPALVSSASRSQTNFVQSRYDFTSVAFAATSLNAVPVISMMPGPAIVKLPSSSGSSI